MSRRLTTKEFIERSILVHGSQYEYGDLEYETSHTKLQIRCRIHGSFMMAPYAHLNGNGCPQCGASKLDTSRIKIMTTQF